MRAEDIRPDCPRQLVYIAGPLAADLRSQRREGRSDEALTMVRRGLDAGPPEWLETELEDAGRAAGGGA